MLYTCSANLLTTSNPRLKNNNNFYVQLVYDSFCVTHGSVKSVWWRKNTKCYHRCLWDLFGTMYPQVYNVNDFVRYIGIIYHQTFNTFISYGKIFKGWLYYLLPHMEIIHLRMQKNCTHSSCQNLDRSFCIQIET